LFRRSAPGLAAELADAVFGNLIGLIFVLVLFYISEMPKYEYGRWYDWNERSNTELLDVMAKLRHLTCRSELLNLHARQPGSLQAIEAIKSSIDFWAERETGYKEYFWGKPPSVG
jgi:hypothetical protein